MTLQANWNHIETSTGVSLFVRDWGAGDRTAVFLAGWGLCSRIWSYQMLPLSERGIRCVAYDRRGHGRSGDPGRGYDFDTLADDLDAVLRGLDLRDVTLIGHSMGAGEIVRYLSRHGSTGRIRSVVFAGASIPSVRKSAANPGGIDDSYLDAMRLQIRGDMPQWVRDNAPPFFDSKVGEPMSRWVESLIHAASVQALANCLDTALNSSFEDELRSVSLPVTIIHGDKDMSAPIDLTGRRIAALLPDSRFICYEGAPHGLMITHRERFTEDLAQCIAG